MKNIWDVTDGIDKMYQNKFNWDFYEGEKVNKPF